MLSLMLALGLQIWQRWEPLQRARVALGEVQSMLHLTDVVHELQRERGLSLAYLAGAKVELELVHQHDQTDKERTHTDPVESRDWFDLSQLDAQRQRVLQGRAQADEVYAYFTLAINHLVERYSRRARQHDDSTLRGQLITHLHLMRAKEQLGRLRALMARHLASTRRDDALVLESQRRLAVFDEYAQRYLVEAEAPQAESLRRVLEGDVFRRVTLLLAQGSKGAGPSAPWKSWFDASTLAIDELRALEIRSLHRSIEVGQGAVAQLRQQLIVAACVLLLAWGSVAAALLFSLTRLMRIVGLLVINLRRLLRRADMASPQVPVANRLDLNDVESVEAGWAQVLDAAEQLQTQASVDALTGVFNRRGLETGFAQEQARAQRHGRPMSLLILDLDHFKRINDTFGHHAGDQVLRETCTRLQQTLRGADLLGRWGGEEFVVIAPESDEIAAQLLAEKLRLSIGARPFPTVGGVFVSIGVAQWQPDETLDALCARADRALYAAKGGGRNRVAVFSALAAATPGLRLVKQ